MMDIMLEQIIKKKLDLLVDFITEKNSNANKKCIYRKIRQLNILPSSPIAAPCGTDNRVVPFAPGQRVDHRPLPCVQRTHDVTMASWPSVIKVQRSEHLNYVLHPPPHARFDDLVEHKFVMNIGTQTIIGVENSKGEIEPLNKYLIEMCHKYKLRFEMPSNLNVGDEISEGVIDDDEIHKLGLSYKEEEDEENDD